MNERIVVEIEVGIKQRAKLNAALEGKTFREVVEALLKNYNDRMGDLPERNGK